MFQNRAEDWELGSKGCYDAKSLSQLQDALHKDMKAFAKDNMRCCATLPIDPHFASILEKETLKCSPDDLAKLMADHTQVMH